MNTTPQHGIDPALLEIIVCPACRGDLAVAPATGSGASGGSGSSVELVCQACGLAYPVKDDIPVLLVDEARKP